MRRIFVWAIIGLFLLSLIPIAADAGNLESTSTALKSGSLVKGSWQSVYYYGADGKRYVFPNEKTYMTWYVNFDVVIHISDDLLGSIPIGGNVTYKPNTRLVKITTDPKVYFVDKEGTLRHLATEEIAKSLYGYDWYKKVDDIPDAYFVNYKIGDPLKTASVPTVESSYSINQDKLLSTSPDPSTNELGAISLKGAAIDATTVKLSWTTSNFYSPKGFKVVMADHPSPVYPGDNYHYLSDPNSSYDKWHDLWQGGTYYFRVCEYLGGGCGIYSNEIAIKVGGKYSSEPTVTDNSNGSIELIGSWSSEKGKVILQWKPLNMYSAKGFKVVESTSLNPVYPGNDYHYLSDPNTRSDVWYGLPSGTHHFRVCEYLGGSCGIYSNDISVYVP